VPSVDSARSSIVTELNERQTDIRSLGLHVAWVGQQIAKLEEKLRSLPANEIDDPARLRLQWVTMSTSPSDDEAQVRRLIESWAAAIRARDLAGVVVAHAPDMLMLDVPPPVQLRGAEDYQNSWPALFEWFGRHGRFDLDQLEVVAGRDVAYAHAFANCAGENPDGSEAPVVVRLTICLRKIDGAWSVTHEHHSLPSS
jgi:uncharacterized protein (TIGR02246 family)